MVKCTVQSSVGLHGGPVARPLKAVMTTTLARLLGVCRWRAQRSMREDRLPAQEEPVPEPRTGPLGVDHRPLHDLADELLAVSQRRSSVRATSRFSGSTASY